MNIRRSGHSFPRLIPRLNTVGPGPRPATQPDPIQRKTRIGHRTRSVRPSPTRRAGHGYRGFIPLLHPTRTPSWRVVNPVLLKGLFVQIPPIPTGRDEGKPYPRLPLKPGELVHRSTRRITRQGKRTDHLPDGFHPPLGRMIHKRRNLLLVTGNQEIPPSDLPQSSDLPAVVVSFGDRISLASQKPDDLLKQSFPPLGNQGDVFKQHQRGRILLERLQCQPDPPQGEPFRD